MMPRMRLVCLPSLLGVGVASVFAAVDAPGGACVCGTGASGNATETEVDDAGGSESATAADAATVQKHTKLATVTRRWICILLIRFRPGPHRCKRLLPVRRCQSAFRFIPTLSSADEAPPGTHEWPPLPSSN